MRALAGIGVPPNLCILLAAVDGDKRRLPSPCRCRTADAPAGASLGTQADGMASEPISEPQYLKRKGHAYNSLGVRIAVTLFSAPTTSPPSRRGRSLLEVVRQWRMGRGSPGIGRAKRTNNGSQTTADRRVCRSCIPETATELSSATWIIGQRNRLSSNIVPVTCKVDRAAVGDTRPSACSHRSCSSTSPRNGACTAIPVLTWMDTR